VAQDSAHAAIDYRVSHLQNVSRGQESEDGENKTKHGWSELSSRWQFSYLVITFAHEKVFVQMEKKRPQRDWEENGNWIRPPARSTKVTYNFFVLDTHFQ
jgi:hypothetical protein